MDKLSIAGILISFSAIAIGFWFEGGAVQLLFHFPALMIVLGGTLGATMLQSSSTEFILAFHRSKWIVTPPNDDLQENIFRISQWAYEARQHGFLILEKEANVEEDKIIQRGLNLLIDGTTADTIRSIYITELKRYQEKLFQSIQIYESMGGYAPTIGILGAVLGLVIAMSNLDSPELLAEGIATAFVATIYGVAFANLLFIPIARKLENIIEKKIILYELYCEGLCCIANGESPRNIELKLASYL